ncbi:M56 family metallopeptidase [Dokdonella koreensis]|uniref:Peptidase M56 domain-containing protein n=1 Tax=Dokdonella koreensis DS-123 TaxID=1300342 RepID=A0A160DTN9_9GAMM|nr:M56 family metallopeptidase [Dokdonella koreensis]ANB17584.1 Hypothetical protein I596_1559 [Dokdonella koreensis DS-123]
MIALIEWSASALATLAVHATVLLAIAWLAERLRLLRSTQALELAWRFALFGALLSSTVSLLPSALPVTGPQRPESADARPRLATVAPPPAADARRPAGTGAATRPVAPQSAEVAAPKTPPALVLPPAVAQGAVALWLAGLAVAMAVFVRRSRSLLYLWRRGLGQGESASAALHDQTARLAGQMRLRTPAVRVLADIASPMMLPRAVLLLPRWSGDLAAGQQRALLAHELAHQQRCDPYWRIAQHAALLPLFFHPLAWHARRRLESLAEDACDATAAALLGSGRPLAECLATCLSHARGGPRVPAFAAAMAHDASPVVRRVHRLLEESTMSTSPSSALLRRGAFVCGLFVLVALPGVAVTTLAVGGTSQSVEIRSSNGKESVRFSDRRSGYALDVDQKGKIEFNADESDVAGLADGAYLDISETTSGVTREIRFKGTASGVDRRYRVDGTECALDAEGRAWIAALVPRMLRETGVQAEARSRRLLARGGAAALLAEIDLIQADHARAGYLRVLFADAPLSPEQQARALALVEAIDSAFEKRNVLQAALGQPSLSPALQVLLLKAAAGIDSDFERAELLVSVAGRMPVQGEVLDAWSTALNGIGSDFERRRVIEALLKQAAVTPDVLVRALDGADSIGSDFEKRSVLEAVAARRGDSPEVRAAYLRLAAGIGSDFERRQALVALLDGPAVDAATAQNVLAAVATMGSDFEAREVLVRLARVMPEDAGLIERYRGVARGLGDFERGQAEKALDRFAVVN